MLFESSAAFGAMKVHIFHSCLVVQPVVVIASVGDFPCRLVQHLKLNLAHHFGCRSLLHSVAANDNTVNYMAHRHTVGPVM